MLATLTSSRYKPRQLRIVETWDYDEVSTRNCIHCRLAPDGRTVYCAKDGKLTYGGSPYSYAYVITPQRHDNGVKRPVLIKPCLDCADFNNLWNKGG